MLKMKKAPKKLVFEKLVFVAIPIILFLHFALLCVGADFLWGNIISFDRSMQYFSSQEMSYLGGKKTMEEEEFRNFHLTRLVRGEDRRKLNATGFACDKTNSSIHCVSTNPVRIDTSCMTVYIPTNDAVSEPETMIIRPYGSQYNQLNTISPVRMIRYNTTTTQPCRYHHRLPAVVFSSGKTGNIFHEMSEIIIPLYITTKQFQSRVIFVLEDYNPSFITKYAAILARLSSHDVINPAANATVHCFPASIVGLKYYNNLVLNSSDIPGGYGMPEFRQFLRQAFHLKFSHVSQISRPRLLLLSREKTRRFLDEDELIAMIKEVGFDVIVVRGSKLASNLNKFSQLINSCSVLLGAHGAGLTNEIFLPTGGVMIQVEVLGTEWPSHNLYGGTARAMGVHYLRYKIEAEESSLVKLYGRNSSVVADPGSVYREHGLRASWKVFLDLQNVRLDLARFRGTLVEALSIVTDWAT